MFNIEFCSQSLDSCNILQISIEMNDAGQWMWNFVKNVIFNNFLLVHDTKFQTQKSRHQNREEIFIIIQILMFKFPLVQLVFNFLKIILVL